MGATGMERDLLKPKLMLSQDIPEDMEDMDMEVMVAMDVATTERGKLMLSQATMVATDMEVMVAMDVATTERGRLMLNQDTPEAMVMVGMDMEVMDVDTMARGKLAMVMVVMDMEVMDVDTMARGK